jgi:hypothetical protein
MDGAMASASWNPWKPATKIDRFANTGTAFSGMSHDGREAGYQ